MTNERFRFRVFLESENKMLYSEDWVGMTWLDAARWAEEGLLMQATGLKDVHGRDIFENDIVEVYNTYKEECFRGAVHFNNGSYHIRKDDLTSHSRFINYEMRIIGNTFETPKLLVQE